MQEDTISPRVVTPAAVDLNNQSAERDARLMERQQGDTLAVVERIHEGLQAALSAGAEDQAATMAAMSANQAATAATLSINQATTMAALSTNQAATARYFCDLGAKVAECCADLRELVRQEAQVGRDLAVKQRLEEQAAEIAELRAAQRETSIVQGVVSQISVLLGLPAPPKRAPAAPEPRAGRGSSGIGPVGRAFGAMVPALRVGGAAPRCS